MTFRTSSRRLRSRVGALVLALVQLGVSAAVVSADAVLDAEAAGHATHVESEGSEECATHHNHLFCQVVRTLAHATGPSPAVVSIDGLRPTVVLASVPSMSALRPAILSGALGSRAPPLG